MKPLLDFLSFWVPVYLVVGNAGMVIVALLSGEKWKAIYWSAALMLNISVFKMRG